MKQALPLRPQIVVRETALSFFSRLAAANGLTGGQFAEDMELSFKRIANLDNNTIKTLAELGGLDAKAREEMVSWSGKGIGNVKTEFRGEKFGSRAVRGLAVKGCPVCLREDVELSGKSAQYAMALRGHWQLRDVHICIRHQHPLTDLWIAKDPRQRSEIWSNLSVIVNRLLEGDFDQDRRTPTAYDLWLDRRLENGHDPTWLAGQSLYASITFCNLLGEVVLRNNGGNEAANDCVSALAAATGFDVVRRGRDTVRACLDDLAMRADGSGDRPNKAFGDMYRHLGRTYLDDTSFAPFRDVLRDCILDIWPIAAGVDVLGEALSERRLHSISTASAEIGVGTAVLSRFLENLGAVEVGDPRPVSRQTFDTPRYSSALLDIQTLVGSPEFRKLVGATIGQFNALVADGVVIPAIDDNKIQARWRPDVTLLLVAKLKDLAVEISSDDAGWESLSNARLRTGVDLMRIIEAIRASAIEVGMVLGENGYRAFRVRPNQIDGMEKALSQVKNQTDLSLTDFCRIVGLRSRVKLRAFLEAGHSSARIRRHPTTGLSQFYLSEQDVAAFHNRFMTLSTIERCYGQERKWLRSRLKAAAIPYFAPGGNDFGKIYLRREIEKLL